MHIFPQASDIPVPIIPLLGTLKQQQLNEAENGLFPQSSQKELSSWHQHSCSLCSRKKSTWKICCYSWLCTGRWHLCCCFADVRGAFLGWIPSVPEGQGQVRLRKCCWSSKTHVTNTPTAFAVWHQGLLPSTTNSLWCLNKHLEESILVEHQYSDEHTATSKAVTKGKIPTRAVK